MHHTTVARDVQYDKTIIDGTPTRHTMTYQLAHVVLGLLLFLLLALPSIYLLLWGYPSIQWFNCADLSLRHPILASMSTFWLLVILFGIPLAIIIFVEAWRFWRVEHGPEYRPMEHQIGTTPVNRLFVRLFIFLGYFFLGAVFLWMIVDIIRYGLGRPKPYFGTVCNGTCIGSEWIRSGRNNSDEYCHNDWNTLKYARMSFPSWPAAFAWHNMVWVVIYLQARHFWTVVAPIFRPTVQFLCLVAATCVSVMQIRDLQYHVSDVVGGALIGALVAVLETLFMARMWHRREWPAHVVALHEESHYRYPEHHGVPTVQLHREVREEEKTHMAH